MAGLDTKQKILAAAVGCFNSRGLVNARLQHIADEAFMSLGNLTYHFRNKEAILQAIWTQIEGQQSLLLTEFRILPLFEDIERLMISTFELQQQYAFFYLDTLDIVRNYPDISIRYRQLVLWQIQQLELALEFNKSRGAFRSELLKEEQMQTLATQFWITANSWMYCCHVQGEPANDYKKFQQALWGLLFPYFTDIGLQESRQTLALLSDKDGIFGN
ncbi:MAG: TetR family transcriptional regulator [Saprospiraceae bacterium]|nr:TetR family transcriptional regulator [Saprospiraceae bacterium]